VESGIDGREREDGWIVRDDLNFNESRVIEDLELDKEPGSSSSREGSVGDDLLLLLIRLDDWLSIFEKRCESSSSDSDSELECEEERESRSLELASESNSIALLRRYRCDMMKREIDIERERVRSTEKEIVNGNNNRN
jgi:hypothetical protein